MSNRSFADRRADESYLTVDTGGNCIYCGERATVLDHFFPISIAADMLELGIVPLNLFLVPACSDCNTIAGANIFDTFEGKVSFIKARLRTKHRRLIEAPGWTEHELLELSTNLAHYIRNSLLEKKILQRRLEWPSELNLENVYTADPSSPRVVRGGSSAERFASRSTITYGGGSLSLLDEKLKRQRVNREFKQNLVGDFGVEEGLKMYAEIMKDNKD